MNTVRNAPGMSPGADEGDAPHGGTPIPNYDTTTEHLGLVDIAGILVGGCFVPWAEMTNG